MTDRRLTLSREDAARVGEIEAMVAEGAAAVPRLVARLTDPSWAVRRSVVAGLAQLGDASTEPLCRVLREQRDDEARLAAAVDALSASRGDVDDAVMGLAASTVPPAVVCDAAQILGRRKSGRAVPLLERLTGHADDNVAVAAVEALGRVGHGAGIEALVGLTESNNFFRVFPAIDVLGRSGDGRAVPALVRLLNNFMFAAEAARALGRTGDERATPALAALLAASHEANVRLAAVALVDLRDTQRLRLGTGEAVEAAVGKLAPPGAAAALARALAGSDLAEKRALAEVLGWVGGDDAAGALFGLLSDEKSVVEAASNALKRFRARIDRHLHEELRLSDGARRLALLPLVGGRTAHLDEVIACLDDPDPAVRVAACEALARIGDPRAVPALFEALRDGDPRVGQASQGAIQSLGSPETERLTLAAAQSGEPSLRRAALRIIAYFGYRSGIDPLLAAMHDPDARLREAAVAGLAFVDTPRAKQALLAARQDPQPKMRAAVVRALGQSTAEPDVLEALRGAATDADAWVRYYAAQGLGRLRDEASTPVLVSLLRDAAGQVRVAAVEALARLTHPEAFAALTHTMRANDPDLRRAALVGLGQCRRPEALPMLLEALGSSDAATRLVAASALAEFDSPEVLRALRRAAGDADETVRSAAVELLSARTGALATELLSELVDSLELRDRVSRSLANPVAGRVDGLVAALEHASEQRAPLLTAALARMRRPDAEAALILVLRSGPVPARLAAVEALAQVRTAAAREALMAASTGDAEANVRRVAALALEG